MNDADTELSATLPSAFDDWTIRSLESLPRSCLHVPTKDQLSVRLRRFRKPKARRAVLLVHGASAGSRTFMVPRGGLVKHLVESEFDVWTLDWRGSNVFRDFPDAERWTREAALPASAPAPWSRFNLDAAAAHDLTTALHTVGQQLRREAESPNPPVIGVVGHCVGGALVMQALAAGLLTQAQQSYRLGAVVLSTLALFYRVGIEGWLKGNEFVLEELTTALHTFQQPHHPVINPAEAWPSLLEDTFRSWRTTIFAPNGWGSTSVAADDPDLLARIAFMYGMPFHTRRLSPELTTAAALKQQFGDMPLGLYMHCVRNLRLGYAAPFFPDDRRTYASPEFLLVGGSPVVPLTLITGAQNQVWHRDSIDRTHEWLLNQTKPGARSRIVKHVLPNYAHQDLLWSEDSPKDVYSKMVTGLLEGAECD